MPRKQPPRCGPEDEQLDDAYPEEYAAARPERFGRNRGEILEEGLELLQLLDGDNPVTFDGRHYSVHELETHPKPSRRPLRVLVGGHQRRAIARAVRFGQGWIPGWRPFEELRAWIAVLRESAAAAERDAGSGRAVVTAVSLEPPPRRASHRRR